MQARTKDSARTEIVSIVNVSTDIVNEEKDYPISCYPMIRFEDKVCQGILSFVTEVTGRWLESGFSRTGWNHTVDIVFCSSCRKFISKTLRYLTENTMIKTDIRKNEKPFYKRSTMSSNQQREPLIETKKILKTCAVIRLS